MGQSPMFEVLDIIYDYKEHFSNMDYITLNNLLGQIKSQEQNEIVKDYKQLLSTNQVYKQSVKHLNKELMKYVKHILELEDKIRQYEAEKKST